MSFVLPTPNKTNILIELGDLIVLYPTVFPNQSFLLWESESSLWPPYISLVKGKTVGVVPRDSGVVVMLLDRARCIFGKDDKGGDPRFALKILFEEKTGWIYESSYTYTKPYGDKTW